MKVDIIIPTFSAGPWLERCLESVRKHIAGVAYQVLVIDDASEGDVDAERYRRMIPPGCFSFVRLPCRSGVSAARSRALSLSTAEMLLLLDDDAELLPGTFELLWKQVTSDSRVVAAGPRLLNGDGTLFSAELCLNRLQRRGAGEIDQGQRSYCREADALAATCLLLRRSALEGCGGFGTGFFPSQGEDFDLCIRLRQAGGVLMYCGHASAVHAHLFRMDGPMQARQNLEQLRSLRESFFSCYPLADSSPHERAISLALQSRTAQDCLTAVRRLRACEALWPGGVDNMAMMAVCQGAGLLEEAAAACRQAMRYEPRNPYLIDALSGIVRSQGDIPEAGRLMVRAARALAELNSAGDCGD